MKTTESIRCKECGHRVMYKPRTHRSECFVKVVWKDADYLVVCLVTHHIRLGMANNQVQFEARQLQLVYGSRLRPSKLFLRVFKFRFVLISFSNVCTITTHIFDADQIHRNAQYQNQNIHTTSQNLYSHLLPRSMTIPIPIGLSNGTSNRTSTQSLPLLLLPSFRDPQLPTFLH